MGVFDKLKNVFFEEEYVEVEEPVKKPKKQKTTIAKKVDLPEMPKIKEEKTPREKEIEEEVVERVEKKEEMAVKKKDQESKFPMGFDLEDFEVDDYVSTTDKPEPKKPEKRVESIFSDFDVNPSTNAYSNSGKKEDFKTDYTPAGLYEGGDYKKDQKIFRPTPIISPIYGILDKNYKKEEIVQKKEVRLTSASSKRADLDTVREKAYGDLASDITASMNEPEKKKPEKKSTTLEDSLYDLSDTDQPVVNNVTVGDAEEYFSDLGLEYNVDYKDHGKEVATGRRSTKTSEKAADDKKTKETDKEKEDSLFDLIDSMYQDSEEE